VRYKVVPEPRSLESLASVRRAIPLVPDSVDDCCARVQSETVVDARDDARDWISFAEALELVERTDRGYRRVRETGTVTDDGSLDPAALAGPFRENVFGAREVLDAVGTADGSTTVADVFDRVRDRVPEWERNRDPDWEATWRERVRRLLEWGVLFGLVEPSDDGYRRVD